MEAINDRETLNLMLHIMEQQRWLTEAIIEGSKGNASGHAARLAFWANELHQHLGGEVSRAA